MLLADPYARKKSRTPSKNRVWIFFRSSKTFTGDLSSKTQCSQWEKPETATTTASEHSYFALYEAYGTRPYEWSDGVTGDPDRQKANTKEEETDLGLLFEGMRIRNLYDGTFMTRDPLGYADGPNVYCYVHCNPITRFDPLGLTLEYTTTRAEEIANHIMEHGSDQNKADLQGLIDSDLPFTMGTTSRDFNGSSEFTPDNPNAYGQNGKGGEKSGGHINIEVNSKKTEFSLESTAAHEIKHASDSANGLLTEHDSKKPGYDTDGNGIEDNEDRATAAQRSYQKTNGEDLREDYNDAFKGESNKAFLMKMYPEDYKDHQKEWDEKYENQDPPQTNDEQETDSSTD